MLTRNLEDFILIKTNYDGMFLITISQYNGDIIYKEPMCSNNKKILLEGFSLKEYSLTVSPLTNDTSL